MHAARGKAEWLDAYTAQLATQRKLSPHTLDAYGRDLRELLALSADTPWTALAHNEVRRYAAKLHGGGLDPRSIARKLSSWRGFFNWLSGETALDANPVDGIRAPSGPRPCRRPVGGRCRAPRGARATPARWRRAGATVQPRHVRTAVFERLARFRTTSTDTHYCKAENGQPRLAGLARHGQLQSRRHGQGQQDAWCPSARPPSWP